MIGTWEIIVIILIVLILFGANKIPEFVKSLSTGIKEFKNAANNIDDTQDNNS